MSADTKHQMKQDASGSRAGESRALVFWLLPENRPVGLAQSNRRVILNLMTNTNSFAPTHQIATGTRVVPVRLEPGESGGSVLYTREEWDSCTSADWEVQEDGRLTFQGRNPRPSVATLHLIGEAINGRALASSAAP